MSTDNSTSPKNYATLSEALEGEEGAYKAIFELEGKAGETTTFIAEALTNANLVKGVDRSVQQTKLEKAYSELLTKAENQKAVLEEAAQGMVDTVGANHKGDLSAFLREHVKKTNEALAPYEKQLGEFKTVLEGLKDTKEPLTEEAFTKVTKPLIEGAEALVAGAAQHASRSKLALAAESMRQLDLKKVKGDELKNAKNAIVEAAGLHLGEGALFTDAEQAVKYIETAPGMAGRLRSNVLLADGKTFDGIKRTAHEVFGNPLETFNPTKAYERGTELLEAGKNRWAKLGNTAVSVAGVGFLGDAILRGTNREGEERSTPGRMVEAAIGLGAIAAPMLGRVKI